MPFEGAIYVVNELRKGLLGVVGPVAAEKMIEEDIDYDSGESSSFGGEHVPGPQELFVCVSEAVKPAVHHDPSDDFIRVIVSQRGGRTLHEVTQQVADARGIGWSGQVKMSEIVQRLD